MRIRRILRRGLGVIWAGVVGHDGFRLRLWLIWFERRCFAHA